MNPKSEHIIKARKTIELVSKLQSAIGRRIIVANELKDVDIKIIAVERVDGVHPQTLICIRRLLKT